MVVLMLKPMLAKAMLVGTIVITLSTPSSMRGLAQTSQPEIVEIDAERFSFTPSEIRMKRGVPIELRIRSDDTNHGFRILDTDVNVLVPKRGKGTVTVPFRPDKPGRYIFECTKLCGAGHGFMRGVIIVSE
jgi:cytochrome c oxidase subunit 2